MSDKPIDEEHCPKCGSTDFNHPYGDRGLKCFTCFTCSRPIMVQIGWNMELPIDHGPGSERLIFAHTVPADLPKRFLERWGPMFGHSWGKEMERWLRSLMK